MTTLNDAPNNNHAPARDTDDLGAELTLNLPAEIAWRSPLAPIAGSLTQAVIDDDAAF
jgi:hypothetical protein